MTPLFISPSPRPGPHHTDNLSPGVRIVLYKIYEKLGELDSHRAAVTKQMNFLSEAEPETFLNKAIDCHLRLSTVANK